MLLAEQPLAVAWLDRDAAGLIRADSAAPPGDDARARVLRLMLAAVASDAAGVEAAVAEVRPDDPRDLAFLAEWAGYWTFGAAWRAPFGAVLPDRADWQADARWLAWRRACAATEQRDEGGTIPLAPGVGPLRCEVAVNGVPLVAILDTGAPASLLAAEAADSAGVAAAMELREIHDGAGLSAASCGGVVRELQIGDWRARDLPVEIAPISPELGVAAILSPFDLFGRIPLTFEVWARRVIVGSPEPKGAEHVPVYWSEGVPSLRLGIGKSALLMLIDSGAGGVVVTDEAAERAGLSTDGPSFLTDTALGKARASRAGPLPVALGGLPALSLPAYVKPSPERRVRPLPRLADGYLGTPWFSQHLVHFPVKRGMCLVAPRQETGP